MVAADAIRPALRTDLPYSLERDFAPVALGRRWIISACSPSVSTST
jgi:hypothetical protein